MDTFTSCHLLHLPQSSPAPGLPNTIYSIAVGIGNSSSSESVLMEFLYAMDISSSHQKANQGSWCLETPQCSCSQCNTEAGFGWFTIPDSAISGLSPQIVSFPDGGHRCKRFPCPICNLNRSQLEGMSKMMLEQYPQAVLPVISFGDGEHRCRKFPCPVCHTRRAASLQVNEF
jgi:Zn finger protein HypA/HybF involved in hydrogenase expression